MGLEGALPYSHYPAIGPYSEPDEYHPLSHTDAYLMKIVS
jgi:hypothetical protein